MPYQGAHFCVTHITLQLAMMPVRNVASLLAMALLATPATASLRRRDSLFILKDLFQFKSGVLENVDWPQQADRVLEDLSMSLDYSLSFDDSMSMPSPKPPTTPSMPTAPAPTTPTAPASTVAPMPSGATPTAPPPTLSAPTNLANCLQGTTKEEYLQGILADIPGFSTYPTSSKGMAFEWFVNTDTVNVCTYPTVQQRYALAAFWFSTGGAGWTNATGWMTAAPECTWEFILCNADGNVTSMAIGT